MAETLTDMRIFALQQEAEESGRVEVSDASWPGLRLRISRTNATWSLLIHRPGGYRLRQHLGDWPEMGPVQARHAAATITAEQFPSAPIVSLPIYELISRYERERACHLKRGAETIKSIRRFLRPLGNMKVDAATAYDLRHCATVALSAGVSSANRSLSYVRTMFNWAVRNDLCNANPANDVDAPALELPKRRILTTQEIVEIWDICPDIEQPFGSIVQLMILTMAKASDVVQMLESDLTVGRQATQHYWTIPAERSRTGTAVTIPLVDAAVDILRKQVRNSPKGSLVFQGTHDWVVTGLSSRKSTMDYWINVNRFNRLGLEWKLGDIRHTFEYVMQYEERLTRREINLCLDRKVSPDGQQDSSVSDLTTRRQVLETWWSLLEGWLIEYSTLPEWRARRSGDT